MGMSHILFLRFLPESLLGFEWILSYPAFHLSEQPLHPLSIHCHLLSRIKWLMTFSYRLPFRCMSEHHLSSMSKSYLIYCQICGRNRIRVTVFIYLQKSGHCRLPCYFMASLYGAARIGVLLEGHCVIVCSAAKAVLFVVHQCQSR